MKLRNGIILASMVASFALVGCGGSDSKSEETPAQEDTRFSKMPMGEQFVMQDSKTNLEWVEGNGNKAGVSSGCNPIGAGNDAITMKTIGEEFCADLDFAGHTDWRMATPSEHQEFITGMEAVGKVPFYANPACPRLVGIESSGDVKSVNTHNTAPTGGMTPWADLPMDANNAGIKCVRTMTMMP